MVNINRLTAQALILYLLRWLLLLQIGYKMLKERFSMAGKFKSAGEMGLTADISLCVKCGGASQPLLLKTFLQLLTY